MNILSQRDQAVNTCLYSNNSQIGSRHLKNSKEFLDKL